jgi:hypothetical protein
MEADDPDAQQRIAASSFPLARGEGGLFQFSNAHPDDPWLRYWVALLLAAQGRDEPAARERAEAWVQRALKAAGGGDGPPKEG